jgi:beta-xylosidase
VAGRARVMAVAALGLLLVLVWQAPAIASTAPAFDRDLPDPFVLRAGDQYYAYATGSNWRNLQVTSSPDLATWTEPVEVLPTLPAWADWGFTWAPSVLARPGTYVMYYTVRHRASGRQCISVATSSSPAGPFADSSSGPLICQVDRGGSIDPQPFVDDDGSAYLLWKSDDNALGRRTQLWSQRLDASGLKVTGKKVAVLKQDRAWEDPVIEGPALVRRGNRYLLFYGANWWESPTAGIGYAVCDTPLGPCRKKTTKGPWLGSSAVVSGPAGPALFTDADGALSIAYHGWAPGQVGYPDGKRALWIDRLDFVSGAPVVS